MKSLFFVRRPAPAHVPARDHGPAERRRFRARLAIAPVAVTCLIDTVMFALFWIAGAAPAWLPVAYGATTAALCGVFVTLLITGFSERFKDPYLTMAQVAVAAFTVLTFALLAPGMAFYLLCVLFIIVAFGALRLSSRSACVVGGLVALASGAAFYGLAGELTVPQATPGQLLLVWLGHALVLARCMHLGLYSSSLRARLHVRNTQLAASSAQVERLANTDELTGTLNRRALWYGIERLLAQTSEQGRSLWVAMLDLDHFKTVNDRFGHTVGDETLRRVAEAVRLSLRGSDLFGRYGGEEFAVALPGATADEARAVAQRMREAVGTVDWQGLCPGLRVSISIGVALAAPGDGVSLLMSRADRALYRAKAAGRDTVMVAGDDDMWAASASASRPPAPVGLTPRKAPPV